MSNDKNEWIVVDDHSNDSTLNDANVVATFQTKDLNQFYRFIKIRQTGINWQNDYQMIFYNIDFYGKLKCI